MIIIIIIIIIAITSIVIITIIPHVWRAAGFRDGHAAERRRGLGPATNSHTTNNSSTNTNSSNNNSSSSNHDTDHYVVEVDQTKSRKARRGDSKLGV